jgi:cytochrome c oxidase subunit 3
MGADSYDDSHHAFELADVKENFASDSELGLRLYDKTFLDHSTSIEYLDQNASKVLLGANLTSNEYGHVLFADYFFFITGFHGFHVFSGVVLLIILLINTIMGTYERRGHYEMVEKIGLYWHFVDLVWVFVFTFFYLV